MQCRIISLLVVLPVVVVACQKAADRQPSGATAAASAVVDGGDDPCIYLASTEAEAYVGPLATPPFRFEESTGAPDVEGNHCMYRGRNGREIMVDVLAGGARTRAAVTAGVPRVMGRMLKATGHQNQESVPAAIAQQGEQGPWDNAQWMPVIGTLQVVKGDSGVVIDVLASNAGEQGAYALAREAVPRLGRPLEYNGAHAAALAPKPRASLANPCDLIPRARVEQAIGSLSAEPEQDASGAKCTYRVATADGTQEYPLDITWINGARAFAHMKGSVGSAATALGMPGGGVSPALPPEAQKAAQQMIGQISKMTGGAVGAPGLMHPASDSTLTGPWDAAGLVAGMLVATEHNVMVQLTLGSADYDKAKALLAAACEQLRMKRSLILALVCATLMGMTSSQAPRIPLVKDLTIWRAQRGGPTQGDYEGSIRVEAMDAQSVTLISSGLGVGIDTRMARTTMRDGRTYREVWTTADPEVIAGATSMMVSSALLNELATKGSTTMTIIPNTGTGKSGSMLGQMSVIAKAVFSDSTSTGTPYTGTLRRIEPAAMPFSVLINGHPSSVAAIHARGIVVAESDSMNIELYILDDPLLPIVLQSGAVGGEGGRVIKITYPDSSARSDLEQHLADKRPAEVYDIYFDYNEATITHQSDVALRDIAGIMRRHPDWRLDIVGHTDSIGGSGAGNMALSARRATAVSTALTSHYGVAAGSFTTRGAGGGQPVATNSTLEGRAKNRRVELRRL